MMFLLPTNILFSFEMCSTPKLSKHVNVLSLLSCKQFCSHAKLSNDFPLICTHQDLLNMNHYLFWPNDFLDKHHYIFLHCVTVFINNFKISQRIKWH